MTTLATDYTTFDLEQLEAASQDLTQRRDDLSVMHKRVQAALDVKRAERDALAKLEAMPPAERAAMEQLIRAGGIASAEATGAAKAR